MDQESVSPEIVPRSVLAAIKQANSAVEGREQGAIGDGDRMQRSLVPKRGQTPIPVTRIDSSSVRTPLPPHAVPSPA